MSAVAKSNPETSINASRGKGAIWGRIFIRLVWVPGLILQAMRVRRLRRQTKAERDEELQLYAELIPNGFLHYGYFHNPDIQGEEISFTALDRAQHDYVQKLADHISDSINPVLDVGCGMGGIAFMLEAQNYEVVALTPDQHQARYIRSKNPGFSLVESDFESFDDKNCHGKFGTVLTAESLQYLDLEVSLPKIARLLQQDGRWIACDYFRMNSVENSSGHVWQHFCDRVQAHGMRIVSREDITENVLPTLKFASLMAQRFVYPAYRFLLAKIRRKAPVLHYIFEEFFESVDAKLQRNLKTIDPEHFFSNKRYLLLVIEKAD